jgi:geranylgeranyl reductase family protein
MNTTSDVVVVGGGPAGSAAAYWLARWGRPVTLVEKERYPRDKTCGDGLTPRSIHELQLMGFDFTAAEFHRIDGLRSYAGDLKLEMPWPRHSVYPSWGGIIRRSDLDAQVAALAEKQGVVVRQQATATPVLEQGRLAGVELTHDGEAEALHPRVVVIADGSQSRFGRALGTTRDRGYPFGLAARGYFTAANSSDGFMESHLDLRDRRGDTVPGYGWVFPLGDGTANVGVGLLSQSRRWKGTNTSLLMDTFVEMIPDYWEISPQTAISKPRGGKLLMGFSIAPLAGPNWVVAGDAAGAINPLNGEGIAYAYETGRLAAEAIHRALATDDLTLLARYPQALEQVYGPYYKVGRIFVKAIGRPAVMRTLVRTGMRSRPLMEWVLKVMANLLEPEERTIGDEVYRAIERLVRVAP